MNNVCINAVSNIIIYLSLKVFGRESKIHLGHRKSIIYHHFILFLFFHNINMFIILLKGLLLYEWCSLYPTFKIDFHQGPRFEIDREVKKKKK